MPLKKEGKCRKGLKEAGQKPPDESTEEELFNWIMALRSCNEEPGKLHHSVRHVTHNLSVLYYSHSMSIKLVAFV